MWDDDYYYEQEDPDRDNWEQARNEKINHVYNLIDLLIKLKVLGPGFDVGISGHDQTGEYVDRHWKV
jgi:hypothetical protein